MLIASASLDQNVVRLVGGGTTRKSDASLLESIRLRALLSETFQMAKRLINSLSELVIQTPSPEREPTAVRVINNLSQCARCHSDLAHNFVLAHRGCNAAKSDHLAFERHLESWARRNSDLGVELDQRFEAAALIHDVNASISMARWANSYVEGARGQVWIKANQFKHLDNMWREFLAS